MLAADALEGEILQRRFAVLQVLSQHGGWVRCRVHDMQSHERREAMVRLGGKGEPEVELLPEDQTPAPVSVPAPQAESPPVEAPPPETAPPEAQPAPKPGVPPAVPPPVPLAEDAADPAPEPERSKKPGRLEAAWFATGANAEEVDEEDRPVEDGDILIAPSKVEQVASDLTTGTYRRYALDGTPARPVAVPTEAAAIIPSPSGPDAPAVPIATGNRRLLLVVVLVAAGIGLLTLLFALLR